MIFTIVCNRWRETSCSFVSIHCAVYTFKIFALCLIFYIKWSIKLKVLLLDVLFICYASKILLLFRGNSTIEFNLFLAVNWLLMEAKSMVMSHLGSSESLIVGVLPSNVGVLFLVVVWWIDSYRRRWSVHPFYQIYRNAASHYLLADNFTIRVSDVSLFTLLWFWYLFTSEFLPGRFFVILIALDCGWWSAWYPAQRKMSLFHEVYNSLYLNLIALQ